MSATAERMLSLAGRRLRAFVAPSPSSTSASSSSALPILVAHGYPDTARTLLPLVASLAVHRAAASFDFTGTGASDAASDVSVAARAEEIVGVLDALEWPRVLLYAQDMGAFPALACAARHPARIAGVVITHAWLEPRGRAAWDITLLRRTRAYRLGLPLFPSLALALCRRTFLENPRVLDAEALSDAHTSLVRHGRDVARWCDATEDAFADAEALLSSVRAPALLLWGDGAMPFPVSHATFAARIFSNAVIEVMHGGRHWMAVERPGDVAACIEAFARRSIDPSPIPDP